MVKLRLRKRRKKAKVKVVRIIKIERPRKLTRLQIANKLAERRARTQARIALAKSRRS